LKRAGAAAEKLLKCIDLTARLPPIVHLSMRAVMIFGRAKEGARVNAPDRNRGGALMLAYTVTRAPIMKATILDGRLRVQEMRMSSGHEKEFVGMTGPRFQKLNLGLKRRRQNIWCRRLVKRTAEPGEFPYIDGIREVSSSWFMLCNSLSAL
jgi:hypothetical protein